MQALPADSDDMGPRSKLTLETWFFIPLGQWIYPLESIRHGFR